MDLLSERDVQGRNARDMAASDEIRNCLGQLLTLEIYAQLASSRGRELNSDLHENLLLMENDWNLHKTNATQLFTGNVNVICGQKHLNIGKHSLYAGFFKDRLPI